MTIEIRQLVIRAVVQTGQATHPGKHPDSAAGRSPIVQQDAAEWLSREDVLNGIVATCVRTVLRRLERSQDR